MAEVNLNQELRQSYSDTFFDMCLQVTGTEDIVCGTLHRKCCYRVALDISKSLNVLQYQTQVVTTQ